jgi:NADPH-dependent 2,4-dienoyl-CoA reductase/sulfur reductase-like enzyme
VKRIVIIGNGISGITAARHIRKRSAAAITVVSSETKHFYSRTALMYIYMGHMTFGHTKPYEDYFWKKNRIDLVFDHAEKIDIVSKAVILRSGGRLDFDSLIIATGSVSNRFDWPGQELGGVQTLYGYPDLMKLEENTRDVKRAVIVGGGLIGIEMAEMLASRNIEVTFLVREPEFWSIVLPLQEAGFISRHIRAHGVDLRLGTQLKAVLGDGRVKSVVTENDETIDCQFVGLTVGVSPNVELAKKSGIEVNRGVLVNEYLETNVPGIYAAGDCVERKYDLFGRSRIEQLWYTGRMMGEVVAQTICGEKTRYEPGPWFNSAKFFDIEYQTYGNVAPVPRPGESDFYWEELDKTVAIHFVWSKDSLEFLGVNSFGMRLRHETFDRWLRQKKTIGFVIENLGEANFDPEFFTRHEQDIAGAFAKAYPQLLSTVAR